MLFGMVLVTFPAETYIMQFIPLERPEQLDEIKASKGYTAIFKHNTTCPISKNVRNDLEQEADTIPNLQSVYFLDLLAHRDLSDAIAEKFNVEHQSPQLLLIKDGQCTYDECRYDISAKATADAMQR
jgi:bacillithiol system protein YtxJ